MQDSFGVSAFFFKFIRLMVKSDKGYKLLALFGLAFLLFNFPLLGLFSGANTFLGIPLLLWYILFIWIVIIVITAILIERK
jgi:hypothetical protein